MGVRVEKGVAYILREGVVRTEDVEGIVWRWVGLLFLCMILTTDDWPSHHHWDHTGDPSTFPPSTELIVGPGFKDALMPGFPTDPNSSIAESAYKGRTLREISFQDSGLKIGRCSALDFFGDGSFYLLDTPGHAIGHMCGLCRTSANPDSFMFLGGDCAHHGGEIRPTPYLPLPPSLDPSPIPRVHAGVCPGSLFASIHRLHPSERASTEPFLLPRADAAVDVDAARESITKLGEFDGYENVFTVLAHDDSVLDVVGKFPERAYGWKEKGWREKTLWRFLRDFGPAVKESKAREGVEEVSKEGGGGGKNARLTPDGPPSSGWRAEYLIN